MRLITYFAPKGGSGRTTAMMTTASGLISAGHSVAVLDLTEQARPGWTFGPSFISQWEDRMVETGTNADQFVTTPACDYETAHKALEGFSAEKFDYVLVDTARQPSSMSIWIMNQSDLVIVPMRGPHEAAWSSQWLATNPHPKKRTFGLVTDAIDRDTIRLARAVFTGGPMLNTWLQNLVALGGQFNTGLLRAKRRFHDICPDDTSREYLALSLDWVFAKHAADALCHEIKQLLEDQNHPEYSTNVPLAAGNTFAHLHTLLEQPSFT